MRPMLTNPLNMVAMNGAARGEEQWKTIVTRELVLRTDTTAKSMTPMLVLMCGTRTMVAKLRVKVPTVAYGENNTVNMSAVV